MTDFRLESFEPNHIFSHGTNAINFVTDNHLILINLRFETFEPNHIFSQGTDASNFVIDNFFILRIYNILMT